MSQTDKAQDKKRDDDMVKRVSDLRDRLEKDLDKIDKAKMSDWAGVRPVVERDLNTTNTELRRVALVTKVQTPQTGAASKQPPSK